MRTISIELNRQKNMPWPKHVFAFLYLYFMTFEDDTILPITLQSRFVNIDSLDCVVIYVTLSYYIIILILIILKSHLSQRLPAYFLLILASVNSNSSQKSVGINTKKQLHQTLYH